MKVSSTVNLRSEKPAIENVQQTVDAILKSAFDKAKSIEKVSMLDNTLFVYMGLLKVQPNHHSSITIRF